MCSPSLREPLHLKMQFYPRALICNMTPYGWNLLRRLIELNSYFVYYIKIHILR